MRAGRRKPQNVSVISNRSPRPQARQLWLVCYNTPAPPGESLSQEQRFQEFWVLTDRKGRRSRQRLKNNLKIPFRGGHLPRSFEWGGPQCSGCSPPNATLGEVPGLKRKVKGGSRAPFPLSDTFCPGQLAKSNRLERKLHLLVAVPGRGHPELPHVLLRDRPPPGAPCLHLDPSQLPGAPGGCGVCPEV